MLPTEYQYDDYILTSEDVRDYEVKTKKLQRTNN